MTTNHPSDFSFDTYPGLDADLTAAYERNVTLGTAEPSEEIASAGLAAAVGNALHQTPSTSPDLMAEEVHDWSAPELTAAIGRWRTYDPNLLGGSAIPLTIESLAAINPNFATTMNRLYGAKEAISNPGDTNPEGLALGETMHLALVPWQAMRDKLDDFRGWINEMRANQGLANTEDFINTNLLKAIKENQPIYRDLSFPDKQLISPTDYLDRKIAENGPWGVMLAQTSNQAGIDRMKGQSPNKMTDNGDKRLTMNNQVLDQMGVFEWLALTFQEDPKQLSSSDYSWLLANRLTLDGGGVQVPYGDFRGGQVGSSVGDADTGNDVARVRLAVM